MTTGGNRGATSILDDASRIGGAGGIAFVVLFIVGAVLQGNTPSYGDSAATIRTFFSDNANQFVVAQWITAIGVVFGLVPFGSAVRGTLGKVDTSGGLWPRLAFGGILIWVVIAGAHTATFGALALDKTKGLDDATLLLMNAMNDVGFSLAGLGLGLFTLSASVVIWRTGVFWRWLAVPGILITVLVILGDLVGLDHTGTSAFDALGGIGYVGAALFVLVLSILMLAGKDRSAA